MRIVWGLAVALSITGCSSFDSGGDGGGGSSTGSKGAGGVTGLPCDVEEVLRDNCQACHSDPPKFGAPMPLVTYQDIQAPTKSDPKLLVKDAMKARIHDPSSPMPPTGLLDAASMKVLDGWLDGGTPRSAASCGSDGSGGGPAVGPDALPCKPTHQFLAHGESGGRYHVPDDAQNLYECFTFKSPWNGKTEGTAWAPIIGDARVLHHWILYKTATAQPDGGVGPCEMPTDATFVAGWAPGGENFVFPKDVGLELAGPDDSLILQVHYHNIDGYKDADDASGVALCTTDTPREHEAGVFTLGTVDISIPPHADGYTTSGVCPSWATKLVPEPLHVIATFPHMHELGRSIKTDVSRGSDTGKVENLVDVKNFSFDNQVFYRSSFIVNPGDSLKTTCTYDNPGMSPVSFGENTEDEMCFDFVMLYPIDIFTSGRTCGLF